MVTVMVRVNRHLTGSGERATVYEHPVRESVESNRMSKSFPSMGVFLGRVCSSYVVRIFLLVILYNFFALLNTGTAFSYMIQGATYNVRLMLSCVAWP
jgi:hypothetical protein